MIDGNAFSKDPAYRIKSADLIIAFSANQFVTLARFMRRFVVMKMGLEKRVGAERVFVHWQLFPLIFRKYPKRKREILERCRSLSIEVIVIKNHKQANEFLEKC